MGNDLEKMSAKDLKKIAESMGLVKGEDFKTNASAKDMLELINSQNDGSDSDNLSDEQKENQKESIIEASKQSEFVKDIIKNKEKDNEYEVVTPVKKNGKILVKGDSIEFFEGIESLIKDGIIKEC